MAFSSIVIVNVGVVSEANTTIATRYTPTSAPGLQDGG